MDAPVLRQLPADIGVPAVARVVVQAVAASDPEAETWLRDPPYAFSAPSAAPDAGRGQLVAVCGPAGAPGRTTVAIGVADEAARLGVPTLLVDADPYGGTVAPHLGLVDETAGLALACRDAVAGKLAAHARGRPGAGAAMPPAVPAPLTRSEPAGEGEGCARGRVSGRRDGWPDSCADFSWTTGAC